MMTAMGGQLGLAYAFVEREIALSKRYWAWELVWLVYGIVTSLSVAYIGLALSEISGVALDDATVSRTVLYLLVGTIAWRFLGIIFENIGEVIAWERWEGTIEYTFMSPVPRFTHLIGMCGATLVRATAFSIAILAAVTLFVPVDLSRANVLSAVVLLAVGALAFVGLGIASASMMTFDIDRAVKAFAAARSNSANQTLQRMLSATIRDLQQIRHIVEIYGG